VSWFERSADLQVGKCSPEESADAGLKASATNQIRTRLRITGLSRL